ncbi:alpha-2,8-polysialyltransferase family protein [Aliarcobacter cryaerophilus]|uniref:alpha-2,8-polysialyltransferase family protein n=1 Tax=Aliarcobacter cryaerophilus TaxID=28198 RepID=UPI0021B5CF60|nr:alpha-2,8-polysialyltransferase family protein [Aliarcobacter cryaerophilus]MCT7539513.1 alpha-2,8-polysialyltransferase family protein [Aliarcobacter cryaerophilus]
MKNRKNLFIINSPLQLLNAQEAIYKFKLKNIIIVAIFNRSIKNIEQIEGQLSKIDCEDIIRFNPSKEGKIKGYIKLIKELQKSSYEKVFAGEIEDYRFRTIIANLEKEQFFVLDEGSATIVLYEKIIKKNKINQSKLKSIRFLMFGLKVRLISPINFFTYYNFEPLKDAIVVKNNLEYLRKDFKRNDIDYSNTLFFLGQPLFIFANRDEFKESFKKVIEKNKDKKIVYIPHREDKQTIEIVKDILKNIDILEIDRPIERYFLENGIYPKNVISYSSTALTTIKILFENCFVEYIKNKNPNLKLNDMRGLDFVYQYFEKSNIKEFK